MIFNSIRWRVQVWHALILVTVLIGFGVTAYRLVYENQIRSVDRDLERRMDMTMRPPPPRPGVPPPRPAPEEFRQMFARAIERAGDSDGVYLVLWQPGSMRPVRSAGAPSNVPHPPLAEGKPYASFGRTRGETREVMRWMPFGDCLLAGRSLAPENAALRRLALWLLTAGSGVLALGLAGGGWMAARAIRPISEISATAQRIAAGDLSQRINVADTESELGRLAGVLNSTFARLEASFEQQARFTSDASHELRTPVAVILSQTQTSLARERAASDYREALEACQRAAQRMRKLTESLLQLTRLDAGQEPVRRERAELGAVTRESVDLVRPLATIRGIEIRCALQPAECFGDAQQLGQLVTNLLSNAIQFNCEQGAITVSTQVKDGTAQLSVTDTGIGIPAEDLGHIFERFYRVDKSRSRQQGSSGLGLAICKAIVDAHGGAIGVESTVGSGSTFTVRIPLAG
jgi:signal transduction histidine kinase